ncbi:MAG: transposase [Rectinemataceae bacterium]
MGFIAQVTLHIPPKGNHLVRRYGLYSSRGQGARRAELGAANRGAIRAVSSSPEDQDARALVWSWADPRRRTGRGRHAGGRRRCRGRGHCAKEGCAKRLARPGSSRRSTRWTPSSARSAGER